MLGRAARIAVFVASGLPVVGFVACGGSSETEPGSEIAAEAGPDPDAAPAVVLDDASPPDAEADAGSTDAAIDAPAKGFCASRSPAPRFCDDFDDADLDDDWTVQTVLNGAPILDTSAATSLPASFGVETIAIDSDESAHVHLRANVAGTPTGHVVLAFEMMLATATYTRGTIAIATLDVSPDHFFTLYLRDADPDAPAPVLEETSGATTTRHVLSKLPPAVVWTRVTIDVDVAGAKASVLWGNEKVLDQAAIAAGPASAPRIRVGAVYVYGPADPFEARFDDVTLDF